MFAGVVRPPTLNRPAGQPPAELLAQLQSVVGNRQVGLMVARLRDDRAGCENCPPSPEPLTPRTPGRDPGFQTVAAEADRVAEGQRTHEPPAQKAKEAQDAASGPSDEVVGQASARRLDDTFRLELPKSFNADAFKEDVRKAVAAVAPQNRDSAQKQEDLKIGPQMNAVQTQATSSLGKTNNAAFGHTQTAVTSPLSTGNRTPLQLETPAGRVNMSGLQPKAVTPMGEERPGPRPGPVRANRASPAPVPPGVVSLDDGVCRVECTLAAADVTDEQLARSNEPTFLRALDQKRRQADFARTAPQEYRQAETQTLDHFQAGAHQADEQAVGAMHAGRELAARSVASDQGQAKTRDETTLTQFSTKIQNIFNNTNKDVTTILSVLRNSITNKFQNCEREKRKDFDNYLSFKLYDRAKSEREDDRLFSGEPGASAARGGRAFSRLLFGDREYDTWLDEARRQYIAAMDGVIDDLGVTIGNELNVVSQRIKRGWDDVLAAYGELPQHLRESGRDALDQIRGQYEGLVATVEQAREELVQTVADLYTEAVRELDEKIAALREANKGLVQRAVEFVKGVIDTIKALVELFAKVLARVASVIGDILKDPIGFFRNLAEGVKRGLDQFVRNFVKHLEAALIGWLTGELGLARLTGVSLDPPGILRLLLDVLGITWANVRERSLRMFGPQVVAAAETSSGVVREVAQGGLTRLVSQITAAVGNLRTLVIDPLIAYVQTAIIQAGIRLLVAMFVPAGGFIAACRAAISVFQFLTERAAQIAAFVNSVLNSLTLIVRGNVRSAADAIEASLATGLTLAISFLASLAGVSGIAARVRRIFQQVQAPVNRAIDAVLRPLLRAVQQALRAARRRLPPALRKRSGAASDPRQRRVERAVAEAVREVNRKHAKKPVDRITLVELLEPIRSDYSLKTLVPVEAGGRWVVEGEINPKRKRDSEAELPRKKEAAKFKRYSKSGRSILTSSLGQLTDSELKALLVSLPNGDQAQSVLVTSFINRDGTNGEISIVNFSKVHIASLVGEIDRKLDERLRTAVSFNVRGRAAATEGIVFTDNPIVKRMATKVGLKTRSYGKAPQPDQPNLILKGPVRTRDGEMIQLKFYGTMKDRDLIRRSARANTKKRMRDLNRPQGTHFGNKVEVSDRLKGGEERPTRAAAMGGSAREYAEAANFTGWEALNWEWLHLIARSLGGNNEVGNLVAGSYDANTEMIPAERAIAEYYIVNKSYIHIGNPMLICAKCNLLVVDRKPTWIAEEITLWMTHAGSEQVKKVVANATRRTEFTRFEYDFYSYILWPEGK